MPFCNIGSFICNDILCYVVCNVNLVDLGNMHFGHIVLILVVEYLRKELLLQYDIELKNSL